MTDDQFKKFLTALQPKEKPWLQKMAENMAVTIFTGALTACLFLGWHMYMDMAKRVSDLEDDSSASTKVFTEEIAQLRTKADSISRVWDRIGDFANKIDELKNEHIEQNRVPWMQSNPGPSASTVSPPMVPSPPPPENPTVQQTPGLVNPDELFKGLEAKESELRWKLEQQRKR